MNDRSSSVLVCVTVILVAACQATAQSPKAVGVLLRGWDRNQNGLLEKSEIPEASRKKFEIWAKGKGLDSGRGLPIKKLLAKDAAKSHNDAKIAEQKREKAKSTGEVEAKYEKTSIGKSKRAKPDQRPSVDAKSAVKGFGAAGQTKRASGFLTSQAQETSAPKSSEGALLGVKKDKETSERQGLRFLAKSMMAQHDSNKNGKLDKSELSRLRGNPSASDRNGDGVLTTEELEDHLAGFATREKEPRAPRRSKASSRSKNSSPRKTYRFLTPHERLPKGLPSWFTAKDLNEDGQLSLREYALQISQAKLGEFLAFDLNNDGFIVPKEYLKSTE